MSTLKGKAALVTGGSRGIGAAIASRLAQDGASVALTYHSSREKAVQIVDEIERAGGKAIAIEADAADEQATRAAVRDTVKTFGSLDILVNNAGVAALNAIENVPLDEFDRLFMINVRGVFVASQEAARVMPRGGRIITIGSCNADRIPIEGGSVYSMTKAAVTGLTRGMARDLGPRGITVNVLQVGPTDTDLNPSDDSDFSNMIRDLTALKRYASPNEIAAFVSFIASSEAGFITGIGVPIDGGHSA